MRADLHMHSTASDGVLPPDELMHRAAAAGVEMIALTDHDCIDGLELSRTAALAAGMGWVSGVELSAQWQSRTLHILGYGFDPEDVDFQQALSEVRNGRWRRAEQIADKLAQKNMPGALEGAIEQQRLAGADEDSPPARPHFADWLVASGYVSDRAAAFQKWLGAGKLGDIRQHWPTLDTVVGQIRAAGGMAVIAHPWQYGFSRSQLRKLLRAFAEAGGRGIEVVNGKQPVEQVAYLGKLSRELGFLVSCGSDFHNPDSPWMALGQMTALPPECQPLWQDEAFNAAPGRCG